MFFLLLVVVQWCWLMQWWCLMRKLLCLVCFFQNATGYLALLCFMCEANKKKVRYILFFRLSGDKKKVDIINERSSLHTIFGCVKMPRCFVIASNFVFPLVLLFSKKLARFLSSCCSLCICILRLRPFPPCNVLLAQACTECNECIHFSCRFINATECKTDAWHAFQTVL